MNKSGSGTVATVALLVLAGCAAGVPQQVAGAFPGYERGIDQDISATHNGNAATLDNTSIGANAPWRLNQWN